MGSSKADKKESSPYEIIRGMWEVPYTAQFVKLFQEKFDFAVIDIQDLEDALIDNNSFLLADIFARLLRFLTEDKRILISTFEKFLKSLLDNNNFQNSFVQGDPWNCLPPDEKVITLKWLIDHVFQEKEEELMEHLDDHYSPDDLRGICAGQDAFNNLYWYYDDLRLYRQNCAKKVNKKDWECVCHTFTEWQSFLKQFRKTTNVNERKLYSYLSEDLFPLIDFQLKTVSHVKKNLTLHNEELIMKEKIQVDSVFEHNKMNSTPNKVDGNKTGDCNGIEEVSQVTPLMALQQQHEDLLTNGELVDSKSDIVENNLCGEKGTGVCSANNTGITNNCVATTPTNSNSEEFGNSNVKKEINCVRTSDCVNSNGLLSNGNDSLLSVESLDNSIKNAVENTVVCDGDRSNVETKSVDSNKPVPLPPMKNEPKVTEEKLPVPNLNNNTMGPTGVQHQVPPNIAMGPPAPSATVQPLPSNVLNKTSVSSVDAQYMQQQSQIFVFSTSLANKGADSVIQGHYPSIILYHCDQPGTKIFLEKHPLKVQQFSKQNPTWLNNMSQMKPSKNVRFGYNGPAMNPNAYNGPCNNARMPHPTCGPNSNCGPNCWTALPNPQGMCSGSNCCPSWPPGGNQPMPMMPIKGESQPGKQVINPNNCGMPGPGGMMPCGPGPCAHGPACRPPNPQMMGDVNAANNVRGMNKIHNDNLTPQQRQHREEQLAMIRKMSQILLPENHPPNEGSPGMMPNQMCNMPPDMFPQQEQQQMPASGCGPMPGMGQRMPGPQTGNNLVDWNKMENQFGDDKKRKNMPAQNPIGGMPPDWKLENSYGDDKKRKPTSGQSNMATTHAEWNKKNDKNSSNTQNSVNFNQPAQNVMNNSPNIPMDPSQTGPRMHGPPPPYPQQSPVRNSVPSSTAPTNAMNIQQPSPISTMSPASVSLSLPSPHSNIPTSSINSPAAPRLPHPSPGSVLPSSSSAISGSSMHSTPLNSPSPALNNPRSISNPTTPGGSAIMTSASPGLHMSGPLTPNSTNNQPVAAEGTFGRTLQSYAQSSQQRSTMGKEPSLMPVPSPQQIQYINSLEGQELTIQKQPNTSLRDNSIMSPNNMPSIENNQSFPSSSPVNMNHQHQTPSTPQYCSSSDQSPATRGTLDSVAPRFPVDGIPHFTGVSPQSTDLAQRFPNPSPQPQQNMGNMDVSGHKMATFSPQSESMNRFPGMPSVPGSMSGNGQRFSKMPVVDNVQRFPSPGPDTIARFPGANMDSIQRMPVMEPGMQFRAPCSSPHHGNVDQMGVPFKYQAMSSPQSAGIDTRLPDPMMHRADGPTGARMRFTAPVTRTSNSPTISQGNPIPAGALSPHMQSLQKMTASFDMVGAPISNKMQAEIPTSPFGNGAHPNGVNSAGTNNNNNSIAQDCGQLHGQKLSHFDPLASMAEMSAPACPSSSTLAPSSTSQPVMMSSMSAMNSPGMQFGSNQNCQGTVTTMQGMQHINTSQSGHNSAAIMNTQMMQNVGAGVPQTVNNTYVNATMSIQQLNIQNASANACNSGVQVQPINAHMPMGNQHSQGAMYPSQGNPNKHPCMSPKSAMVNNMPASGPNARCAHPQHFMPQGQAPAHRGMSPNSMPQGPMPGPMHRPPMNEPRPFNGANVQVKATAPNTIQYLPTRPQRATNATTRPPSLEFLNRFTSPLANLDNKVPTQNLQYFPNSAGSGGNVNHLPPGQNMPVGVNQMMVQPNMNGTMNEQMDGQHMMPRAAATQQMMMRAQGPHPQMMGGDQMYGGMPVNQPTSNAMPVMNNDPSSFGVMGPMPNQMMNSQMMQPGPNPQQMFMGGKPGSAMMTPESAQYLPPSMAHQQPPMTNANFKSNFNGPTASDPNYAAQFHNFQQQLYATNSRPAGAAHMNHPNAMTAQYYMHK